MTSFKQLLRTLDPRALERNTTRAENLASSIKALRQDVRALRDAVGTLASELAAVRARVDQVAAVRLEDENAPATLDALEPVLDADRIAAHLRAAIAQASIVDAPAPHVVVEDVFPPDVYDALLTAIPTRSVFERRGGGALEVLLPPKLAATHAVVTWTFMAEIIERILTPTLLDRFADHVDRDIQRVCPSLMSTNDVRAALTTSQGRLVIREAGFERDARPGRPWDLLAVVLNLARPEDGSDYGSRVRGVETPFRANSLVVVLDSTGAHAFAPIPAAAGASVERCSLEFRIGLDRAGRRMFLAQLDESTRRAWELAGA